MRGAAAIGLSNENISSLSSTVNAAPMNVAPVATIAPGTGVYAAVGAEILVNTATQGNQEYPTIAPLSNGGFVVAWRDFSNGVGGAPGDTSASAVKAQVFSATGARVGGEFLVNTATHNNQFDQNITPLTNGNFLIDWYDDSGIGGDSNGGGVKAQLFSPTGARIGSEFLVNTATAGQQAGMQTLALPNGGFVISWQDASAGVGGATGDNDGYAIKAQLFNASGAKVGSEILVNTITSSNQVGQEISALPNGGFVITWQSGNVPLDGGGQVDVKAQLFGANGAKVGGEVLVNTATAGSQAGEKIATLANGGFVIAWVDDGGGAPGADAIRAQMFDAAGAKIGGEIKVSTASGGNLSFVEIVALSGGGFAVGWGDAGRTVQTFDSLGAKIGGETHPTTFWEPYHSPMIALPTGGFLVVGESTDSSGAAIAAQVYDASGNKVLGEFRVNTAVAGYQTDAVITTLAGGGFAVSWNDKSLGVGGAGGDASGTAVKAQLFQDTGAYLTSEQVALDLKGALSVSDVDGGSSVLTVVVGADYGILHLAAGSSGANISNNDSGSVTVTGTLAQINALLGTDPTSAITYTANTDTPPDNATLTLTVDDGGGGQGSAAVGIVIVAVDDAPVAVADAYGTQENVILNIAAPGVMFNDTDVDGGPQSIAGIDGSPVGVGGTVTLPSGAKVSLNAFGALTYNPNGAFNYLITSGKAAATGAVNNSPAMDSFTYTLNGGSTTTVSVTVIGVDGPGDHLDGNAGNNNITGTGSSDYFDLSQGGNDVANGLGGDDGFFFGAAFTAADQVDGGAGSNDQIGLQGDYTGANALVLGPGTIANIETIVVLPGSSYDITTNDANVAAGGLLKVQATQLAAGQSLHFDGSAETNGSFAIYGGNGDDNLTGGAGNDGFYFGPGQFNGSDLVNGGGGTNDQLALDGNYVITLGGNIANVEVVVLLHGPPGTPNLFNITASDAFVPSGQTITIFGLQVDTGFRFDGSGEHDGAFKIYGGISGDTLIGSTGNDWIFGGNGSDTMTGGAGADTFYYDAVVQSTSLGYDKIVGFDESADLIDLPFAVTGFAAPVSGNLSTASFDSDLAAAFAGLASHQAGMFTATGGTLAGHSFLVIDADGNAGYQAGSDYVIEMVTPATPVDNPAIFV